LILPIVIVFPCNEKTRNAQGPSARSTAEKIRGREKEREREREKGGGGRERKKRKRERDRKRNYAFFDSFVLTSRKKERMNEERAVAGVLTGITLLAFLEQLSGVTQSHHRHQQAAVQRQAAPAASLKRLPCSRWKKKAPKSITSSSAIAFRSFEQVQAVYPHPRHIFALPSSLLPSQPGQFDGSELVEKLKALIARQPEPSFECTRQVK
jgi:hypothetical protein